MSGMPSDIPAVPVAEEKMEKIPTPEAVFEIEPFEDIKEQDEYYGTDVVYNKFKDRGFRIIDGIGHQLYQWRKDRNKFVPELSYEIYCYSVKSLFDDKSGIRSIRDIENAAKLLGLKLVPFALAPEILLKYYDSGYKNDAVIFGNDSHSAENVFDLPILKTRIDDYSEGEGKGMLLTNLVALESIASQTRFFFVRL